MKPDICDVMLLAGLLVLAAVQVHSAKGIERRVADLERSVCARCAAPSGRAVERPLAAVLVTTNLVEQACQCGWCHPERGVVVPEHYGRIGYDLRVEVTTNYLPIVARRDESGLVVRRD